MTALSDQLRRRVARLRPDWHPDGLSGFIYLEGGYSNDNYRFDYRGDRYVLRVPGRPRWFVDRPLEARLYARGGAAGMPEVVAFDPDSGAMIARWVAGRMLADHHPDSAILVDYLTALHRSMPEVERSYDPLAQAREHLQQTEAPRWVNELAARVRWQPDQLAVCHNDLNPWNVIRTPDGAWVTLDWEWVGRNDPLFDLVTLHQGVDLPDRELTEMAERLLGAAPDPGRLARCLTGFWLRESTWAMAELAAGNDRAEIREQQRLGLERLRRFSDGL